MKKTKIMGAALSAVMVGLLAVGCDSAVLNDIAENMDPVKPDVSDEPVTEDMFDPGKGTSLWYGTALNNESGKETTAIMKIEPLPTTEDTSVIDGYIEFAVIEKTGNISNNTGWLGSYKMTSDTGSTKKMKLSWGGDINNEGMEMFSLEIKPAVKEAFLKGSGSSTANYTMTLKPVAIGNNELSAEELTTGFQRSTGADDTNYILSLRTDGTYSWGGKVNGFTIPDGKWKITDKGDIVLSTVLKDENGKAVKDENGEDKYVVINRVAGENINTDGSDKWGRGSVAVEKSLWIAFDSADLDDIGYTGKRFSNLPILFSINTTTK